MVLTNSKKLIVNERNRYIMNKKDLEKLGLTTEALEKAGLKADVLDEVIVLHGKDIESHKSKLAAAQAEVESAKAQLTEAGTTIEGFKKLKPEELQKSIEDYKKQLTQTQTESAQKLSGLKFDHALQGALNDPKVNGVGKVKNIKATLALLDMEAIRKGYSEKDDSFLGLKEQLEKVKTSDDYLFEGEETDPKIVTGTHKNSVISDSVVEAAREAAGLKPPPKEK